MNKMLTSLRKMLLLCGFFLVAAAFTVPVHRYYLGLTEVRVDSKKQTMDVSCKLFTDDLEDALLKKYGKKFDLVTSAKNKEAATLLAKYLTENFKINVGGKLQVLTFVGFETETDVTWCYLETVPFKAKGTVNIYNTLLYDYLPEQTNMINFYWNDAEKSAKLTNPEKMTTLEF